MPTMRRITLITTGGTIEKTYDEATGTLENRGSVVRRMLRRLRLEDTHIDIVELMSKDSLHMTGDDRKAIVAAVATAQRESGCAGVVILHGTDTLNATGEALHAAGACGPVVLTGAMRPFEMTRSDALQNLTEAIFAVAILKPGVYCVSHGRTLSFPGVTKDRAAGTFIGPAYRP